MIEKKSVTLVIAVMLMVILGILGTTLLVMQSSDFEVNIGNLDSERAFYLAESGIEWASKELIDVYDCSFDGDPDGDITSGTVLHDLDYGQYRLDCSCEDAGCGSDITFTSTGFIPDEAGYRIMRRIEVSIRQGSFGNTGSIRNLFDWSDMLGGSSVNGYLAAGDFDGDDDATVSEECEDWGNAEKCAGQQYPPGTGMRYWGVVSIPTIDMDYFKTMAQGYNRYRNYSATADVSTGSKDENLKTIGDLFDNTMVGEAVRLVGEGWSEQNWVVITKYKNKKWVEVELKTGIIEDMDDWDGKVVKVIKRFEGNVNNEKLWYVEGSDILIDVRNDNGIFNHTSLVAEGDIVIIGKKILSMLTYVVPAKKETFPNLATKEGNIISTYEPARQMSKDREFDGLVYTENGDIHFNYFEGVGVIANNATFEGLVKMKYDAKYVDTTGFLGNLATLTWQEK